MLRTPSIFGPLNSGFVPFSPGAAVEVSDHGDGAEAGASDVELREAAAGAEAAEVVARAAAAPAREASAYEPVVPWAPASSARIRVVEGAVLAAICGYFGWGLLRTFAGL
jgi:hypothetical protein